MSGAAKEGFVGLPADGVGKQVRNLQMQVVQPDGSLVTVYMQVMGPITDVDGRSVDVSADSRERLLLKILKELRAIRRMTGEANGLAFATGEVDDVSDLRT